MTTKAIIPVTGQKVNQFLLGLGELESKVHVKRLSSLEDAVLGALVSDSLQPSKMGDGLAQSKGLLPKHARKQVDRLLSNEGIDVAVFQNELAQFLIANRKRIIVAMD